MTTQLSILFPPPVKRKDFLHGPRGAKTRPVDVRFWEKVDKPAGDDGCWPWLGARTKAGYGQLRVTGAALYAHRLSWTFANGDLPAGMDVLHRCDNPPCVNPSHLFLGTARDNANDMVKKGRLRLPPPEAMLRGEAASWSKLTNDDVIEIRRRAASGESHESIAADFPVSRRHVSAIVSRTRWQHVTS